MSVPCVSSDFIVDKVGTSTNSISHSGTLQTDSTTSTENLNHTGSTTGTCTCASRVSHSSSYSPIFCEVLTDTCSITTTESSAHTCPATSTDSKTSTYHNTSTFKLTHVGPTSTYSGPTSTRSTKSSTHNSFISNDYSFTYLQLAPGKLLILVLEPQVATAPFLQFTENL